MKKTVKAKKTKTLLDTMSRDEIATLLYTITNKKNLIPFYASKFRNHHTLSSVLDESGVSSEINETIMSVLKIMERNSKPIKNPYSKKKEEDLFQAYESGFKNQGSNPYDEDSFDLKEAFDLGSIDQKRSQSELRLDNIEDVTGYFVNAVKNNIFKLLARYNRQKRSSSGMVFLDALENEAGNDQKNQLEALTAVNPYSEIEYKRTLVDMAKMLRKHDKKMNQIQSNEKSQLAKLFCSIVNEKKNLDNEEVRNKFGWTPYLLRKNKEVLIEKIRKDFPDSQNEILGFLDYRHNQNRAA